MIVRLRGVKWLAQLEQKVDARKSRRQVQYDREKCNKNLTLKPSPSPKPRARKFKFLAVGN